MPFAIISLSPTYEWNQQANQLANFLRDGLGIRKGDRVSIFAMNHVEYLDALFACNKLGAILHVNNWRLKPRELEPLINDAAPRVLLYSQEFAAQVDALRPRLSSVERFVGLDEVTSDQYAHWPTERSNWPQTQPPPVELDWEDPWIICYTSGNTGLPKGAILHYHSITANSMNTIVSWGLRPDDVVALNMRLFHTGGLNCLTTPLVHLGGTNIVCAGFDIDQLFDQIESLNVTFFFGVPAMLLAIIQHPRWESLDLSSVRLVMSGGGTCPTVVFEAFWKKGVEFKTGYGLTEAGPNTFWLPTELMKSKIGSVGRPLFHIDVKLVDEESGEEIGPGEIGHLLQKYLKAGAPSGETRFKAARLAEWLAVGAGIPGCMHGGGSPDGAKLVIRFVTPWEEYVDYAKGIMNIEEDVPEPQKRK